MSFFQKPFFVPDPDEGNMAICSDSLLHIPNLRWNTNKDHITHVHDTHQKNLPSNEKVSLLKLYAPALQVGINY